MFIVSVCAVQSAWAQDEQTITVSIKESGGLATEIFAAQAANSWTQTLTTVVHLTVSSGELNDADWTTLKSMTALKTLNLSGTSNKVIPARQFYNDICPNLETIVFPSGLEEIGGYAFYEKSKLKTAVLPSTLKTLGSYAFQECRVLDNIGESLPSGVKVIPNSCFSYCEKLTFTIPEGVTDIGDYAFKSCHQFSSTLPSTLKSIGAYAFEDCSMQDLDLVLYDGITITGSNAFDGCKMKSISFPRTYTSISVGYYPLVRCSNLTDVTILSPTILDDRSSLSLPDNSNITIHVPDYLVNTYKADTYFYKYNIVGIDITQYDVVWPLDYSLDLNSYIRMAGEPKIRVGHNVNLTISGTEVQQFKDVTLWGHSMSSSSGSSYDYHNYYYTNWAQVLSTCDNVTVTGDVSERIQTYGAKWYFISLPFDINVADISTDDGAKFAIRYYDGAARAATNTATGNWKDHANDADIPAGTGFIYMTSATTWTTFKAKANATRNNIFKNEQLTTTLNWNNTPDEGVTLTAANKGWNLVGNPWQCYYNIHKMNYSAPISVATVDNYSVTYTAYSLQDDDYALEPNQAFFVQCPDGSNTIGFPIDGRQLTSEVTSAGASRQLAPCEKTRWLVDVQISNGEEMDKTRLVVNNAALMDYEQQCDASKFMSYDGTVPQIYSLDAEGTEYAINERPMDKGTLRLGVIIKEGGQYSLEAIRNEMGQVLLTDHETGITTDLSQHGYSFSAEAGTDEGRFTLSFLGSDATGIHSVNDSQSAAEDYYNLKGQRVEQPAKGVYVVAGKKVMVK